MHPRFTAYGAELQTPIHQFSSSRYSLFDLQACISFNFEENMTVKYNLTLCRCLILGNSTRNIAYGNERFAAPSMERRRKLGTWNRSDSLLRRQSMHSLMQNDSKRWGYNDNRCIYPNRVESNSYLTLTDFYCQQKRKFWSFQNL